MKNYLPADLPAISEADKSTTSYLTTRQHMMEVLDEVSERMRAGSIPWHSAGRYWGQMNAESIDAGFVGLSLCDALES